MLSFVPCVFAAPLAVGDAPTLPVFGQQLRGALHRGLVDADSSPFQGLPLRVVASTVAFMAAAASAAHRRRPSCLSGRSHGRSAAASQLAMNIFRRRQEDMVTDRDEVAEEELRDAAGITLGSKAMRFDTWPPLARTELQVDEDRLKRQRLEGLRGGNAGARDVPLFPQWPVFEADLADVPGHLLKGDPELDDYKVLELRQNLNQAYSLASHWDKVNTGRPLGFHETGANRLSSSQVTIPIMMRQIQGLAAFRNYIRDEKGTDFDEFLEQSGADMYTATELRTLVKGGGGPVPEMEKVEVGLPHLHVDAVVMTKYAELGEVSGGAAVAIWAYDESRSAARVEFCVGHDCLYAGPVAEEVLMRFVAGKAAAMGATRLMCRSKFTVDGKFFRSQCLPNLNINKTDKDGWEADYQEDTGEDEVIRRQVMDKETALKAEGEELLAYVESIEEAVPGLRTWLIVQSLEMHLEACNEWCDEMGAATLEEVVDGREELVEFLGDKLSAAEKEGMLARTY